MLNFYEIIRNELTYYYKKGSIIIKTGNVSVCQAVK